MPPMSRLRARCAQLFRRTDPGPDIEQELRAFVDERTDQGIAAGLAPDEARRRAQVEVGGVGPMTRKLRDQRAGLPVGRWLADLWRDLCHAFRQGYRAPAFSLVAVLTLGLGIGGAAAMFGLIQGVLLSPPPYAEPDRLVLLSPARLDGSPYAQRPTTAQWLAWRASSPRLDTALYRWTFNFLVRNDGSTSLGGMVVTPRLLPRARPDAAARSGVPRVGSRQQRPPDGRHHRLRTLAAHLQRRPGHHRPDPADQPDAGAAADRRRDAPGRPLPARSGQRQRAGLRRRRARGLLAAGPGRRIAADAARSGTSSVALRPGCRPPR